MPAPAHSPLSPDDLYQRLLSSRFEDRELPSGFTVMPAYGSTATVQRMSSELPGAIGAALVTLHGPDLQNTIWDYVFGSEVEASAWVNASIGPLPSAFRRCV